CKNRGQALASARPTRADRPAAVPFMRLTLLALAAVLASAALAPAAAQAPSVEHDALLYLDSQVLPKKAAACAARIPRFATQFDPAFRAWLAAHRHQIAAGEAFLRADAEKTRMPLERDVESVAASVSQQWSAAPIAVLQ